MRRVAGATAAGRVPRLPYEDGSCNPHPQEVKAAVLAKLEDLRDRPLRDETPMIYHLDVAAMYPNIILTNRLQPSAIVEDEDCAACDYNRPDKTCLRRLEWVWRGENFAATRGEYLNIKAQIETERVPGAREGDPGKLYTDLDREEQQKRWGAPRAGCRVVASGPSVAISFLQAQGPIQKVLPKGVQEGAGQAGGGEAHGGHLPARERLLHRHGPQLP